MSQKNVYNLIHKKLESDLLYYKALTAYQPDPKSQEGQPTFTHYDIDMNLLQYIRTTLRFIEAYAQDDEDNNQ